MNEMIYIPTDIREYWETRGGRDAMLEFLRHTPFLFNHCMEALPSIRLYLKDKLKLKHILEDEI